MTNPPVPRVWRAMPANADALAELCARTFTETHAEFNTVEDLDAYIAENFNVPALLKILVDHVAVIFIAQTSRTLPGYIQLAPNSPGSHFPGKKCLEIVRYYLLKEYQVLSIGKELMNKCFHHARKFGFEVVWLCVWQKNEKAIQIYRHFGFVECGVTKFKPGKDIQDDFIMAKEVT